MHVTDDEVGRLGRDVDSLRRRRLRRHVPADSSTDAGGLATIERRSL